jgi:hypothetical protein
MKGDFSRSTFDATKHYSGVRQQQGRVNLDADWNEQTDIELHRDETATQDIIGPRGASLLDDGFRITPQGGNLEVGAGHYYVNGILCENEEPVLVFAAPPVTGRRVQPDLPDEPEAPPDATYLIYLEVWQRLITALEDPAIREVALNGPDTATRVKTVWQVRHLSAAGGNGPLTCADFGPGWAPAGQESTGQMRAQGAPPGAATDCIVPPSGGYRRLENQFYRVEIHEPSRAANGGAPQPATFKWSRDNGMMVAHLEGMDPANGMITVSDPGRDTVLGFASARWVEVTDEARVLSHLPGVLFEVDRVEGIQVIVKSWPPGVTASTFGAGATVRRWDGVDTVPLNGGGGFQELEDGVQVEFSAGTYRTGAYWWVAARTFDGRVEWPTGSGGALYQPPHGIDRHYAPLAIVRRAADGAWETPSDCRSLFPSLSQMLALHYVSGDGQKASPNQELSHPLRARVMNGQFPVAGAQVRFSIVSGGGTLLTAQPAVTDAAGLAECRWRLGASGLQRVEAVLLDVAGQPRPGHVAGYNADFEALVLLYESGDGQEEAAGQQLPHPCRARVVTGQTPVIGARVRFTVEQGGGSLSNTIATTAGTDGIAETRWTLGPAGDQRIRAELLDSADQPIPGQLLHYNAAIRTASGSGCCVTVEPNGQPLDKVISDLLGGGARDICICLMPGDHTVTGIDLGRAFDDLPPFHLEIGGCGLGSRVIAQGPLRFAGFDAFHLHDVAIEYPPGVQGNQDGLALIGCAHVTIASCHLSGMTGGGALVRVAGAHQIRLSHNHVEATQQDSLGPIAELFGQAGMDEASDLFKRLFVREFDALVVRVGTNLAALPADERKQLAQIIREMLSDPGLSLRLGSGEVLELARLSDAFLLDDVDAVRIVDTLVDLRRAAVKVRPGVALVLDRPEFFVPDLDSRLGILDVDHFTWLENNVFDGEIGLYGMPATPGFVDQALSESQVEALQSVLRQFPPRLPLRGHQGTLQVRGNQLVRVVFAEEAIARLRELIPLGTNTFLRIEELFQRLYGRLLFTDNVIDGTRSVLMGERITLTTNEFSATSLAVEGPSVTQMLSEFVVSSSSIYLGNRASDPRHRLFDMSRRQPPENVANVDIAIS